MLNKPNIFLQKQTKWIKLRQDFSRTKGETSQNNSIMNLKISIDQMEK
jgi:hypothetical protein